MKAALALSLALFCSGSSFAADAPEVPKEIPRFHPVSEGLFRGGRPDAADIAVLKTRHGVRTIISMDDNEDVVTAEAAVAEEHGIGHISIPLSGVLAPEDEHADRILALLAKPELRPLFIHCREGRDRTGLLIGLHRVFHDGWSRDDAYDEMVRIGFRPYNISLRSYFERRVREDQERETAGEDREI